MSTITQPPAPVNPIATLADLEATLKAAMYAPGCPPQLSEAAARADAYMVSHLRCPGCGKRRMEYHPWHRGRAYRVLAACSACSAAEEV